MEKVDYPRTRIEQENKVGQDNKVIGAKAFAVQEKLTNPFHVLSDRTIQAIINAARLDADDAQVVREEIEDRKNAGNFHPENEEISIKDDLDGHYFGFYDGRILVPTHEYVDYREAQKRGENRGVFKGQTRETVTNFIKQEKQRAFGREIDAYYADEERQAKVRELFKARGIEDEAAGMQELKERIFAIDKRAGELSRSYSEPYSRYYEHALRHDIIPDISDMTGVKRFFNQSLASRAAITHYSDRAIQDKDVVSDYCRILETSGASQISYGRLDKSDKKKSECLRNEALKLILPGEFLPNLSKKDTEKVRTFVESMDIGRGDMQDILEDFSRAPRNVFSKNDGNKELAEKYDEIFGVSDLVADSFMHTEKGIGGLVFLSRNEKGKPFLDSKLVDGLSENVIRKINQRAEKLASEIQNRESYQAEAEAAKNKAIEALGESVSRRINKSSDPASELGFLTKIKTIDASGYFKVNDAGKHFSPTYQKLVREKLPWLAAEVNTRSLARKAILRRIGAGYREGVGGNNVDFLRLENFREIKDELNISFEDDAEYDVAFDGFIKTVLSADSKNKGFANAAAYYAGIFSEDPERFTAKVNAYREECNPHFKRKISSFLNHNEEYQDYINRRKENKRLKLERSEANNDAIFEATSYEDVQKYIEERKKALLAELEAKTKDANTTFAPDIKSSFAGGNLVGEAPRDTKDQLSDFGIRKIEKLNAWSKYLALNIDDDTQHYARRFFDKSDKLSAIDDPNTYHAITFKYEGHLCAIAESFSNDSSAMFVARADENMKPEELLEKMFESSKTNARKQKDIGVERYYHYEDDLDEMYRKAFAYLYSGTRASNVKEAEKIAHHTLYDESEMGNINEGELPPQWPFI